MGPGDTRALVRDRVGPVLVVREVRSCAYWTRSVMFQARAWRAAVLVPGSVTLNLGGERVCPVGFGRFGVQLQRAGGGYTDGSAPRQSVRLTES